MSAFDLCVRSRTGYVCMVFYHRGDHVVEFQAGELAPALEEACSPYYFNPVPGHYTTLIGIQCVLSTAVHDELNWLTCALPRSCVASLGRLPPGREIQRGQIVEQPLAVLGGFRE